MAFLFSAFDTMSSHTLARFWLCASSTTVVAVRSTISSRPTTYRSAYASPSLNTATIGLPVTEPVSQMLMFSSIFFPFTFHVPSHTFRSRTVVNSGSLRVIFRYSHSTSSSSRPLCAVCRFASRSTTSRPNRERTFGFDFAPSFSSEANVAHSFGSSNAFSGGGVMLREGEYGDGLW